MNLPWFLWMMWLNRICWMIMEGFKIMTTMRLFFLRLAYLIILTKGKLIVQNKGSKFLRTPADIWRVIYRSERIWLERGKDAYCVICMFNIYCLFCDWLTFHSIYFVYFVPSLRLCHLQKGSFAVKIMMRTIIDESLTKDYWFHICFSHCVIKFDWRLQHLLQNWAKMITTIPLIACYLQPDS